MSTTNHNSSGEVLEVKITPAGAASLKRLLGIVRWQTIFGVIFSGCSFGYDLFSRWSFSPESFRSIPPLYWESTLRPVYGFIINVIFIVQIVFYLRFARRVNKGLAAVDTEAVNLSFDDLYRAAVLFVAGTILNILVGILYIWGTFDMLKLRG